MTSKDSHSRHRGVDKRVYLGRHPVGEPGPHTSIQLSLCSPRTSTKMRDFFNALVAAGLPTIAYAAAPVFTFGPASNYGKAPVS
jgi:hypothetical protein